MKVLVAHNRYVSSRPSGENQVVDAEIELLRSAGVDVVAQMESSDVLDHASPRQLFEAGIGPFYAPTGVSRFRALVDAERPDVVHLHNPSPLISPWVIRVAHDRGIPVVQTVHNYRHSCVNGLHFRDGRRCGDCLGRRLPTPALMHGCYRDSKAQTVPVAAAQALHRGTWKSVSRFIALTPFMADTLVRSGLPGERITLRPSWVPDLGPSVPPGRDVLFVGRVDEPKGVRLLLDAWRLVGPRTGRRLRIAGDGPLLPEVEALAKQAPELVVSEGRVSPARVAQLMDEVGALVVPSLCYEGYPLVIAEAFGRGRAVITVGGGSAGTIVDPSVGWVAEPDSRGLAEVLSDVTDESLTIRGRNARLQYERENSPEAGVASLLEIYRSVGAEHLTPARALWGAGS